eukprot:EG_transcript_20632
MDPPNLMTMSTTSKDCMYVKDWLVEVILHHQKDLFCNETTIEGDCEADSELSECSIYGEDLDALLDLDPEECQSASLSTAKTVLMEERSLQPSPPPASLGYTDSAFSSKPLTAQCQTIASRRLIATPVVSTTTGRPPQEGRAPPFGAMGEPSPRSPPTLAGPLPFAPQIFH